MRIIPGDTVVISATPIPGNEETVSRTIDNLMRAGARVLYPPIVPNIHVSGHASKDELKALLQLIRPKYAVPVHGEYRQMVHYRDMAVETGYSPDNILFVEVGDCVDVSRRSGQGERRDSGGKRPCRRADGWGRQQGGPA